MPLDADDVLSHWAKLADNGKEEMLTELNNPTKQQTGMEHGIFRRIFIKIPV